MSLPHCQLCGASPVNGEHAVETQRRWNALTNQPSRRTEPEGPMDSPRVSPLSNEWADKRAALRLGNAFDRLGMAEPPMSVFELRAAVLRDADWNADAGDPHGAGWAAAYDRRGLLNLIASLLARLQSEEEASRG